MVKILTRDLRLPDPSKRKGLRQFSVNFPINSRKINDCFDAHRSLSYTDWIVLATIVNLWAKIGVDTVIRDKLFANGMLERMVPLLQEEDRQIRTSVLFALSNLSHHGSFESRRIIAELTTPPLIDLIDEPGCSARNAGLAVVVLAHGLGSVLVEMSHAPGHELKTPEILRNIDGGRLCYAVGVIVRRPDVDVETVSHGLTILKSLAFYFRDAVLATHTERLFIAALASGDVQVRLDGFMGTLRLGTRITELLVKQVDPKRVIAIARNPEEYFTPDLMQALRSQHGGLKGGMIYEFADCAVDYNSAIVELKRTHDYAEFGRTLAKRILTYEYSLSASILRAPGGETETFSDYLERAANALGDSNHSEDVYLSHVLQAKMAMGLDDREKVLRLSGEVLEKYPDSAFFYYAQATWVDDYRASLRLAKKGLACSDLTDYVKRGLLQRSAEAGYHMTLTGPFHVASPGSSAWHEGVAILRCTQEDSRAYIEMTSLDQRTLKTVIYTYLCATFMLEGDKVFKNLEIVRPYLEKLSLAERIFAITCQPLPLTEPKLAIDLIIPRFANPLKQWRTAIARLVHNGRPYYHHQDIPADDPDHVLANWLVRTALDDEDVPRTEFAELQSKSTDVSALGTTAEHVLLYRCSFCGNPSASLKRCGRCKQARYCDDTW
ncbi:hypothetical protein FRC07_014230 [Ceratobasidium sp. 392]|nr:hypothetical protein FRC07_014230 [Ceratobasidium sp. 392]